MRKNVLIVFIAMMGILLFGGHTAQAGRAASVSSPTPDRWFDAGIGPALCVSNCGDTLFNISFEAGKDNLGGVFRLYLGDGVTLLEPGLMYRYDMKPDPTLPLFLTPMFTFAPVFAFGGGDKGIGVDIDLGLRVKYELSSALALTFTPVNLLINPFRYISYGNGGGSDTSTEVTVFYPLLFGIEYVF